MISRPVGSWAGCVSRAVVGMVGGISTTAAADVRRAGLAAGVASVVTLVGVALVIAVTVVGRDLDGAATALGDPWELVLTIVPYGVAGAILIDRRPGLPFGWLLAAAAAALTVALATGVPSVVAIADGDTGAWPRWGVATGGLLFVPIALQGVVNGRFPSGRVRGRWGRILELAIVAGTVLVVVGGLFGATSLGRPDPPTITSGLRHPLTAGTAVGSFADALIVVAPIVVLLGLVAGIGVIVRCVRAQGLERQQLKWRAAGVVASIALFPFAVTDGLAVANLVDPTVFVLTLAVPVLRYRLWSIDTIVRRSVVYTGLSVLLLLVFAAVTAAGTALVSSRVGVAGGVVVVAITFAPLRDRAQQIVDRLLYGRRTDPYGTLTDLGRQLHGVSSAQDLPAVIVRTVATSLRLPFVAIERSGDDTSLAMVGEPTDLVERWPLVFEGRLEAHLVASPRRGEDGFDGRDRELLADLAAQSGVAVHAASLTDDLLASRQRLVTAREEERRRLRRDLHDGLGPLLTGIGLNLDAARARLATASTGAEGYLGDARDATTQAMDELRRVVHGLRPPALDELGLPGAIQAQAERVGAGAGLAVTVTAYALPRLPAAVEVAAFRTAVEAVNNSVRHGRARSCAVTLRAHSPSSFVVEVDDDGTSTDETWQPGVGLTAMRERVEELGGELRVGPTGHGGARVVALFPLCEVGS
ncbi:MAG: histidine kinase [Ilumatobacteraceae bacterium]